MGLFDRYKKALVKTFSSYRYIELLADREQNDYKHTKVNIGRLQASLNAQLPSIQSLSEVEFQVFSQFGDDGIIQYLVSKLPIKNKTFIEFGVENYRESNTRFLLVNNAWSGLVMDGSATHIQKIRSEQMYSFYDLRAVQAFITAENINGLIQSAGFHPEVGILSVDIDGNDYWVWKAIDCIKPSIVITEYNSLFGFEDPFTIPYKPDFVRGKQTPLNFYGTSLLSACQLAKQKGYFFIGCNSAGNNAYFIHESLRNHCPIAEKTPEQGYNFAIFSETWDERKEPRRGKHKVLSIDGLGVVHTGSMETLSFPAEKIIQSLKQSGKFRGIEQ